MDLQEYLNTAAKIETQGYPVDWKQVAYKVAQSAVTRIAELNSQLGEEKQNEEPTSNDNPD